MLLFQRSQLAAKVADQSQAIARLEARTASLTADLPGLEAESSMCLRHLAAVQQDLTLSLAEVDAGGEEVDAETTASLLAAAILKDDTSFAGDAAATADAVRRALAQLLVVLEDACLPRRSAAADSPEALHARLRAAEDLGNLLRQSDAVLRADLATMSEDLDGAVGELGLRRNQVIALTLRLSEAAAESGGGGGRIGAAAPAGAASAAEAAPATGAGASAAASPAAGARRPRERLATGASAAGGSVGGDAAAAGGDGGGGSVPNGSVPSAVLATRLAAAEAENRELRQVAEGRAAELRRAVEERHALQAAAAAAAAGERPPPSTVAVLGSALYQTMEATLQQLAVAQRGWNRERAALVEDTASEAAAAARELSRVRDWSASRLDDLSRQLAEALKTAEAAAVARDRLHAMYEAKQLDVAAGRSAPDADAVLRQTLERHVRFLYACGLVRALLGPLYCCMQLLRGTLLFSLLGVLHWSFVVCPGCISHVPDPLSVALVATYVARSAWLLPASLFSHSPRYATQKSLEAQVVQLKAQLEECRKRCQTAEASLAVNVLVRLSTSSGLPVPPCSVGGCVIGWRLVVSSLSVVS